jgi:PadR family transcriptional regulator PadR
MDNKEMENVDDLLQTWEEAYKKGLLSFWTLLLLSHRRAYAYEAGEAIKELSQQTMVADTNSIYRALNRFESLGIVKGELEASDSGPPRRYYSLTEVGFLLLKKFIHRNILVFRVPSVEERINTLLELTPDEA